ncbi:MAG: homoserine O-acetyltransferase [Candidatus Egerieousia sp.]
MMNGNLIKKVFKYGRPFKMECGAELPELEICYHISEDYAPHNGKKVIWIAHALTANSNPEEWWDTLVGNGKFFDSEKYTIVCANILGSCYGTTGPASVNPETGRKYLLEFPHITIRDVVNMMIILRKELKISNIDLLIGGSVGGFQCLEWAIIEPDVIENLCACACNARISAWHTAYNESQRMCLYADKTFSDAESVAGGKKGLAAARALSLISYRSSTGYNKTQTDGEGFADDDIRHLWDRRASSYQRYQGEKFVSRFDAYSYLSMLNLADSHDVGRSRGSVSEALAGIKAKTLVIGIQEDFLFPVNEPEETARLIPGATFRIIHSNFGHDGFLLEYKQLSQVISEVFCLPLPI